MTDIVPIPALRPSSEFPTNADRNAGVFNSKAFNWANTSRDMAQDMDAIAESARTNALATQEIAIDAKTVTAQNKTAAQQAQEAAELAAANAAGSAAFYGRWSELTGPLNMPANVTHAGKDWRLMRNLSDVTTEEPGVSDAWEQSSGIRYTEITTSQNWETQGDRWAYIEIVGGGGSGAVAIGTSGGDGQAGGGGGGEGLRMLVDISSFSSIPVVIGAGGVAVTATTESAGNRGGDTSFGSWVARGGYGGDVSSSSSSGLKGGANGLGGYGSHAEGGGGGVPTGGEYTGGNAQYGGPGGAGGSNNAAAVGGTNSYGAKGGNGASGAGAISAQDGVGYGAGGGAAKGSTTATSGAGYQGVARIWRWK